MEDIEKFRKDPVRIEMLQKIINAYDNAVISHQLDENQNIIAVYDKYSNIQINKLIRELRQYENHEYNVKGGVFPFPCVINGKLYEPIVKVEKTFDIDTNNIEYLEKQLEIALEQEDFHTCERIKNKINKLKNQ
ncbi:MAG: hypothetical protein WCJ72_10200 [Chryseobacterium sp.]